MMDLKTFIRDIPDFPKKGIIFKDITTLLKDGPAFRESVDEIVAEYKNKKIAVAICKGTPVHHSVINQVIMIGFSC